MNDTALEPRSVVVERELPHPPEKIWRALTRTELIEEWLSKTDFEPFVGHRFQLRFDWGVVASQVTKVEQYRTLAYTWTSGELDSLVTWTLTPTDAGTRLRMEQVGFPAEAPRYHHGAEAGWPRMIAALEETLNNMN